MQVVGAAMSKLVHIIWGVLEYQKPFDENYLKSAGSPRRYLTTLNIPKPVGAQSPERSVGLLIAGTRGSWQRSQKRH